MLPALPVVRDYGFVGSGVSQARFVVASNGSEYIIKGPCLVPGHFYVAANELIGAKIADILEIPVVDHRVLSYFGSLVFASARMGPATYTGIQEADFNRAVNRDISYSLLVFDVLICNIDRHQGNLLIRWTDPNDRTGECFVVANDNSHCLVLPGQTTASLPALSQSPIELYINRIPYVKNSIRNADLLREAISRAESLDDGYLADLVNSIPDELLPAPDKAPYIDILATRKAAIRSLFNDQRHQFPNLGSGAI